MPSADGTPTSLSQRTHSIYPQFPASSAVWLGDMDIAVPTQFVSTYDLLPAKNSIATIFSLMTAAGELAYSGPPLSEQGSDTYAAWTLIGTYNYYVYSGDLQFVEGLWSNYTRAMAYLAAKVDESGLLYVTGTGDWGRLWMGGYNSEANAIYYQVSCRSGQLVERCVDVRPGTVEQRAAFEVAQRYGARRCLCC